MKNGENFLKKGLFFLVSLFLNYNAVAMEAPSPRTSRDIMHMIGSSTNLFGIGQSDMKIFAEMLGYKAENFLEQDSVSLAKDFVERFKNKKEDVAERFKEAFCWATQKGWVEVIKIFLADNELMFILPEGFVREIFKQAVILGHICVVSELLKNECFLNKLFGLSNDSYNSEANDEFSQDLNRLFEWILEKEEYLLVKVFLTNEKIRKHINDVNIILAINKVIIAGDDDVLSLLLNENQNILSKSNKKHFWNLFNRCQKDYQYSKIVGETLGKYLGKSQDSCIVM